VLTGAAGELRVAAWPAALPIPFGLAPDGPCLRGPARLRWRVGAVLRAAGIAFRDELAARMLRFDPGPAPRLGPLAAAARSALARFDRRGLVCGLGEDGRVRLVQALAREVGAVPLVLVADSAAELRWRQHPAAGGLDVRPLVRAARAMHHLGSRRELLVVDAPELMPAPLLLQALDGAAAQARIGLLAAPDPHLVPRLGAGLGPLVALFAAGGAPGSCELRVPMPPLVAAAYAAAWHRFLVAFDRFAGPRTDRGFGAFLAAARQDESQRPALFAWHAALRLAAWHAGKEVAVAELLARHAGTRTLVFTPDREVAYAIARAHLIAPVTAELPRGERRELLLAFAAGALPALAGPRLLDLGVPEGSAEVGILVGGGLGRAQRAARCRRVAPTGIVYELVSLDSVEVGRARRWGESPAAAPVGVRGG
jgi:hypothetical protein